MARDGAGEGVAAAQTPTQQYNRAYVKQINGMTFHTNQLLNLSFLHISIYLFLSLSYSLLHFLLYKIHTDKWVFI